MPVPPQIGSIPRDDNEMPDPRLDPRLTPGAHVGLACLIRLDGFDGFGVVSSQCVFEAQSGIHVMKGIRYNVLLTVLGSWSLTLATLSP
jgi:hypothetical protein